MNILWISHLIPYPPKGGVVQRSYNLIREVAKEHSVYLIALNQWASLPTNDDVRQAVQHLQKFCKEVEVADIVASSNQFSYYILAFSSLFSVLPFKVRWLKSKKMYRKIHEAIQSRKIDVVHYDTVWLGEYFQCAREIPKVLNHHNIESEMMARRIKFERNILKKFYFYIESKKLKRYERRKCPQTNPNIVVSELDKRRLNNIVPRIPIETIPNGVDIHYFRPFHEQRTPKSLIFAGGMSWYPNRDAMTYFCQQIWPVLKRNEPHTVFTIVGRNPPVKIIKMAKKDAYLKVTGYVDDVRKYLNRAEVYVCPIRDGGGTRLKILDALSAGLPVVATSFSCEGLDVTPEKNVLIADAPHEFVHQIQRIFYDERLKKQLQTESRKLVEKKYSWEIMGRKLNLLYKKIAGLK